tara:strand:- start:778 stop:1119 length:342 start_codon:yes stop_codon:yes gene_type:complete
MLDINELRIEIAEFFGTSLINKEYLFLDYWTIVHLVSGLIGMLLIFKFFKDLKVYEKFILLFILISFWEIFELISSWIRPEKSLDIFYDFVVGMFGGFTYLFSKEKINPVFSQ